MWSSELYILIEASRMIFQYMIFLKNLLLLQFTFCIVLVTMTFYMWNNKNWGFKDSVLIGVEVYPKPGFFVPWINASWTWNFINFLPILWHIWWIAAPVSLCKNITHAKKFAKKWRNFQNLKSRLWVPDPSIIHSNIYLLDVVHFFGVVIFSSRHTIILCRNKSSFTFWKFFFNKVSDKLPGQLLVLPAAKLKTACTKLVFVPRSLWSN